MVVKDLKLYSRVMLSSGPSSMLHLAIGQPRVKTAYIYPLTPQLVY